MVRLNAPSTDGEGNLEPSPKGKVIVTPLSEIGKVDISD
jgi:hypothetical protein